MAKIDKFDGFTIEGCDDDKSIAESVSKGIVIIRFVHKTLVSVGLKVNDLGELVAVFDEIIEINKID